MKNTNKMPESLIDAIRYFAERTFSFNNRELTDYERMVTVTASVAGKRLTYAELKA